VTQPPIAPGYPEPHSLAQVMPQPEPPKRRVDWFTPVTIVVLTALSAFLAAFGSPFPPVANIWGDDPATAAAPEVSGPPKTELRKAFEACGQVGELSDQDLTLTLDMAGEDPNSGDLEVSDIRCLLLALNAPGYVLSTMEKTRALDGRQSEKWATFTASWIYHPDDGLDVIIREI
jgi:hypothetical protein